MSNWLNLEGKVVIVTGGASGIGNHVVTTLKDAGATPVIADISVETGEEKDGIFCTKCDVTNKESVEAMVAELYASRIASASVLGRPDGSSILIQQHLSFYS